MAELLSQPQEKTQEPTTVQLDPKSLHSALKEFFNPLRAGNPRADFFAVYRKESSEFDRDYAGRFDGDLNTALIFSGLFSGVSATFVASVQPKLEQDPSDYMKILIHTMNNTLFSDVYPSLVDWGGPPRNIVIVQSLLYASLATSLFAAFLAMLGKQWVNRYLRNRGGSAADKSRDRQRKLDGHKKWYFYVAIESLPMVLQFALLLFGCALSLYLWTISQTVAWVIVAFTIAVATVYAFFTLAATLYYDCPYQTPFSVIILTLRRYLERRGTTLARSVRHCLASLSGIYSRSTKELRQIRRRLRSGFRRVLQDFGPIPNSPGGVGGIQLIDRGGHWYFGDFSIDWDSSVADAHCISWILNFTTDSDVIFYGAQFAADAIWHPKTVGAISPRILAKLFVECLSYGRIIPGRSEQASVIGMALASVISIQLCMEPEREDLRGLSKDILHYANCVSDSEPKLLPGVGILKLVLEAPYSASFREWDNTSDHLPTTHKVCLSRVILQTVWRWRWIPNAPAVFNLEAIDLLCRGLMANGDHSRPALKIHCLLIMAISLGHPVDDIRTLYIPDDDGALRGVVNFFHGQLLESIREGNAEQHTLTSVLSALIHLDPIQVMGTGDMAFRWITAILNSRYPEGERYRMASHVVRLLGKQLDSGGPGPISDVNHTWVAPLVRFLLLCEKFHTTDSTQHPGSIALRILSTSPGSAHFNVTILPTLTPTLLPTHPLQSRAMALKIFHIFGHRWFSSHMETVSGRDIGELLQAVGDPFQLTSDPPLQDGNPAGTADYDPMMAVAILIEFASSNRRQKHLHRSNFTSCEDIVSREEGRDALGRSLDLVRDEWLGHSPDPAKITAAVGRLRELQCSNTAEAAIAWAQAAGIGSPQDHETWRSTRP